MKKPFYAIAFLMFFSSNVSSQPGTLDYDFHSDGKLFIDFGPQTDQATKIAVQQDGKIIIIGETRGATSYADLFITRYFPDGNLDLTFANQGSDTLDLNNYWDTPNGLAIQPDGKILVSTRSDNFAIDNVYFMARYHANGSLDNSFGNNGRIASLASDQIILSTFALDANGKIVCVGSRDLDFLVFRLLSNGSIDTTFGTNGYVETDFGSWDHISAVAIQTDGKIIAAGSSGTTPTKYDFAVARYNIDGSPDSTFSYDGRLTTTIGPQHDMIDDVVITPDGKILAVGTTGNNPEGSWAVAKYNSNGSLDLNFNQNGIVVTQMSMGGSCNAVDLQGDGKIIISGYAYASGNTDFALLRLNADGSPDSLFGSYGKVLTDMGSTGDYSYCMTIQPDGRILSAGRAYINPYEIIAVARYISGYSIGVIDFAKDDKVIFIYPNPIQESATIEYELMNDEVLSMLLFDMSGKLVKTFISGESRAKGKHKETLSFDESIPAGNYILTINNPTQALSLKIVKE